MATAALIMISVFVSFVLNGNPIVKESGLGLAVSTLIDAAIVLIPVPALLLLIGPATWWLPDWLSRLLPRINIEGEESLPAVAPAEAES